MSLISLVRGFVDKMQVRSTATKVIADAKAENHDAAWVGVEELLGIQSRQFYAAVWLVRIVEAGSLSRERALEVLAQVYGAHPRDKALVGSVAYALDRACDIDMLNAPPPDHPLFAQVVDSLLELLKKATGRKTQMRLLSGAGTAARMMARQRDAVVEDCYRRLIEMQPDFAHHHYNLGLFLKTRGRFREGMLANQAAAARRGREDEATDWNLGICATGAGEAAVALEVWKRQGNKIEMGRFGLPEGGYPACKVKLSQRPLAERTASSDDPGKEESIWIDRLSPCHGIIRSVLYGDLGVDYGDVILFDGAPITYQTYNGEQIPVFPHLATLVRNHYQVYEFAGTQEEKGQLASASRDLAADAVVYAMTENFVTLCAACWRDRNLEHRHDDDREKKTIIKGKIAAPPDMTPRELLDQLDAAIARREPCRIYTPELCEAAGLPERAAVERRRFDMVVES